MNQPVMSGSVDNGFGAKASASAQANDAVFIQQQFAELSLAPASGLGVLAGIASQAVFNFASMPVVEAALDYKRAGLQGVVEGAARDVVIDASLHGLEQAASPSDQSDQYEGVVLPAPPASRDQAA